MTNCGRMTYKVPCAQSTICKVSQASGYIIINSNIETDGACVYNAHFRQWSFYINLSELWRQRSTNGRCGLYAEAGTFGRRTPMWLRLQREDLFTDYDFSEGRLVV